MKMYNIMSILTSSRDLKKNSCQESIVSFTINKGGLNCGKIKGNQIIAYPWENYEDYR